jgi:hypothetical protein
MTTSNLSQLPIQQDSLARKSELQHQIQLYEKYMKVIIDFALGKRILRYGKHANQRIIFQPDDYKRLGNTLSALKQRIIKLQEKLFVMNGCKKVRCNKNAI